MIGMDFVDQVRPGILELQCLRTVYRDEADLFERKFQSGLVGKLDGLGWLAGLGWPVGPENEAVRIEGQLAVQRLFGVACPLHD